MVFRILTGFLILCAFSLAAAELLSFLRIPFPAPLLGMMALFACMRLKLVPVGLVEEACKFILSNMVVLFVPILVGVMAYGDMLREKGLQIFCAVFLSLLLTLLCSGFAAERFVRVKKESPSNAEAEDGH